VDRLRLSQVAILDDLGSSTALQPWQVDAVNGLILERYDRGLSTILISNQGLDCQRATYGERLWSRVKERAAVVELSGLDWRSGQVAK
jgi:DNA replication protein DnaC